MLGGEFPGHLGQFFYWDLKRWYLLVISLWNCGDMISMEGYLLEKNCYNGQNKRIYDRAGMLCHHMIILK